MEQVCSVVALESLQVVQRVLPVRVEMLVVSVVLVQEWVFLRQMVLMATRQPSLAQPDSSVAVAVAVAGRVRAS
jgi:hypothetical protein